LNSYAEDYELSVRLMRSGLVGRLSNCIGAHLRATSSRVSGRRFGYSFVANNWYFIRIGSSHLGFPSNYIRFILVIVLKPLFLNALQILKGNFEMDPLGQIQGALLALADIARNNSTPKRVLDIDR